MSLRHPVTILLSVATLCLLTQCGKETVSKTPESEPLAVVAGHPITADDLLQEAQWRRENRQAVPAPEALLKEMVSRLSLVERARKEGLETEPETRRRIESLLIARLREREIDAALAKVSVSDKEISDVYQERRADFTRKGIDRFSILFQKTEPGMSGERLAEGRKRLEQALSLSDANPARGGRGPAASGFGAVAADHSDDQVSRYRGGDIGWLETDAQQTRVPSSVIDAGRALDKGARSDILETAAGLYVIMKTDSRAGGVRPLEEVAGRLRETLLREKRRAVEEAFVAESTRLANAEMNSEAASKIKLPAPLTTSPHTDEPPGLPGASRSSAAR